MEEKAVRSVPVSVLTYVANKVITVATTIVLARLLGPSQIGLFALTVVILSLLSMFNDLGLGRVLISRPDLDQRGKGTVLTIILGATAVLAAVLVALSSPLSALFDQPKLSLLLVIIAATLLLTGPVYFYEKLLQRELEFKQRFVAMTVWNGTYALVAIGLVALGAGVVGMVIASPVSYLVYLVALLHVAPYRVAPAWDRSQVRSLLRSGRGFLAQSGILFAQQNTDNLVIAKLLTPAQLGGYFLAYRLGDLTYSGIAQPITNVTFPGFARMRHRGEQLTDAFLSSLRLIALAAFPVAIVLSAAASPVTRFFYGSEYLVMIGPLAILGLWALLRPLEATLISLLNSVGQADAVAAVALGGLVPLFAGLPLAAYFFGLEGVAWVVVVQTALSLTAMAFVVSRRAGIAMRRQAAAIAPLMAGAGVSWVVTRLVASALAQAPAFLALAAAGATGVATYLIFLWLTDRGLLRQAASQSARTLRRQTTPAA